MNINHKRTPSRLDEANRNLQIYDLGRLLGENHAIAAEVQAKAPDNRSIIQSFLDFLSNLIPANRENQQLQTKADIIKHLSRVIVTRQNQSEFEARINAMDQQTAIRALLLCIDRYDRDPFVALLKQPGSLLSPATQDRIRLALQLSTNIKIATGLTLVTKRTSTDVLSPFRSMLQELARRDDEEGFETVYRIAQERMNAVFSKREIANGLKFPMKTMAPIDTRNSQTRDFVDPRAAAVIARAEQKVPIEEGNPTRSKKFRPLNIDILSSIASGTPREREGTAPAEAQAK